MTHPVVRACGNARNIPYSQTIPITPGVPVTVPVSLGIGLASQVSLTASLYHAASGAVLAQTTTTESAVGITIKLHDLVVEYAAEKTNVKSWANDFAKQQGDALAEYVFSDPNIYPFAGGYPTAPAYIPAKENLSAFFEYHIRNKLFQAVDYSFDSIDAGLEIQIGVGDPKISDATQSLIDTIQAANDGKSSLLAGLTGYAERSEQFFVTRIHI